MLVISLASRRKQSIPHPPPGEIVKNPRIQAVRTVSRRATNISWQSRTPQTNEANQDENTKIKLNANIKMIKTNMILYRGCGATTRPSWLRVDSVCISKISLNSGGISCSSPCNSRRPSPLCRLEICTHEIRSVRVAEFFQGGQATTAGNTKNGRAKLVKEKIFQPLTNNYFSAHNEDQTKQIRSQSMIRRISAKFA